MKHTLRRSAFFSVGVHLWVLLPMRVLPPTGGEWAADVVRGMSSVDLELVSPSLEEGQDFFTPIKASEPSEPFSDQGVIVDWQALALQNRPPRYPLTARIRGWEGTVLVRVRVLPSGRVGELVVQKGSGHDILDQAARVAIREWRFQPAQQGGRPRAAWVEIPVSFRLQADQRKSS